MMRKVLVAFGLALAVTVTPLGAAAHEGHDHGTKAKKVKKAKPKKAAALGAYGAMSLSHTEIDREQ